MTNYFICHLYHDQIGREQVTDVVQAMEAFRRTAQPPPGQAIACVLQPAFITPSLTIEESCVNHGKANSIPPLGSFFKWDAKECSY